VKQGLESDIQDLIQMRLAHISDEELLLTWRNSPDVVIFTQSKRIISPEEHNLWFHNRLKILKREPIFIFELLGKPIGMTRLDFTGDSEDFLNISILVEGSHRGKGFGISMVKRTSQFAMNTLNAKKVFAVVNSLNSPSMQLFQRCGFRELKNEIDFKTYEWLADDKA
jgi:RimJ/RimL family protein N-acetyltransferase